MKYRCIEAQRRDTPLWVKKIQLDVLECLAEAKSLEQVAEYLPRARELVKSAKRDLRNGRVPLEELVVIQSLSRVVEAYRSPSPAARAGRQVQKKKPPQAGL